MARPGLTLSVSGIAVWQMSLGFKEPSICLVERALTVAIFRSISTSSLKETRNFDTVVDRSSETCVIARYRRPTGQPE